MMTSKRNGNIEILRFLFAIAIMLHHAMLPKYGMPGGYIGVEFFYIIVGYFLAKQLDIKKEQHANESLDTTIKETIDYIIKRIKSILLELLIATSIGLFHFWYFYNYDTHTMLRLIRYTFNDFLFLQSFGIPVASITGIIWFLSSLYISLWIMYPLARRYFNIFTKQAAPIIALTVYGILIHKYNSINVPANFLFEIINTGTIRAIADISVGLFIYHISAWFSIQNISGNQKKFFTIC